VFNNLVITKCYFNMHQEDYYQNNNKHQRPLLAQSRLKTMKLGWLKADLGQLHLKSSMS